MICRGTLTHLQCDPVSTRLTFWIEELELEYTAELATKKWLDKCVLNVENNRVVHFAIQLGESLDE